LFRFSKVLYELFRSNVDDKPIKGSVTGNLRIGSGQEIYKGLKREHAGPIGKSAKGYIRLQNLKGLRAEGVADNIQRRFPQYDNKELARKVRTVLSIATSAIERARAEGLGLQWYVWSTCRDERVRSSHRNMEDVLVSWNDPPAPEEIIGEASRGRYHPGESEECRCVALPMLRLDSAQWPARVHINGRVVTMKRREFQRTFHVNDSGEKYE
jgi:uncharacterized protein with gpF-like domain